MSANVLDTHNNAGRHTVNDKILTGFTGTNLTTLTLPLATSTSLQPESLLDDRKFSKDSEWKEHVTTWGWQHVRLF